MAERCRSGSDCQSGVGPRLPSIRSRANQRAAGRDIFVLRINPAQYVRCSGLFRFRVSMITGTDLEASPDDALRSRTFAPLRPKKRFKENQPSSKDEIIEIKLPAPLTSAERRPQRIKRSGRAQMRWRISPEVCEPAPKLPLVPMLHEFWGCLPRRAWRRCTPTTDRN